MQHLTVTKQELRGEEALRGLREILGVKPSIKGVRKVFAVQCGSLSAEKDKLLPFSVLWYLHVLSCPWPSSNGAAGARGRAGCD